MGINSRSTTCCILVLLFLCPAARSAEVRVGQPSSTGTRADVLEQRIRAILAKSSGIWVISVRHVERNEFADINAEERFQMASVFKIPVLVELYEQAREGKISLDERVEWRESQHYFGSGILVNLGAGLRPTLRDLATLVPGELVRCQRSTQCHIVTPK